MIAQAWAAIKKDFWLYLRWAVVPLLFFTTDIVLRYLHIWTLVRKLDAFHMGWYLFGVLNILSALCFSVRVYRHIILGDGPDQNFFAQMFSATVWKCLSKQMLVGLKWLLYALPFILLVSMIYEPLLLSTPRDPERTIAFMMLCALAVVPGFVFVAEQVVLITPAVAVDGPASLSRLKRLARQHRMRIALTMFLIAIVPWLVFWMVAGVWRGMTQDFLTAERTIRTEIGNINQAVKVLKEHHVKQFILDVLLQISYLAWWVTSLFVSAVMYKRLRPVWSAQEAAEASKGAPLAKSPPLAAADGD